MQIRIQHVLHKFISTEGNSVESISKIFCGHFKVKSGV